MSEPPDDVGTEAWRWLAEADEELLGARALLERDDVAPRLACFLAHLAAEKALKGWLVAVGQPFRKVHDLADLLAALPSTAQTVVDRNDLRQLNPWTIEGRYPEHLPEASRFLASALVAAAERVVGTVVSQIERAHGPAGGEP